MVGRRKVISSPHRRPISPLTTLPPRFGFLAGLEQVDEHHRRCGTRLHGQDDPQVSGGIASKGKETRPRGSDRYTADYCSAVEKAAGDSVADHVPLFMIPGMDHCGLPAQTGRGITGAGFDSRRNRTWVSAWCRLPATVKRPLW
jgi:hypothetical protein